ncbi:hypothetical protein AVDCRST_MAG82-2082, partial [uncultured Rubrobacteraceae bacterium]
WSGSSPRVGARKSGQRRAWRSARWSGTRVRWKPKLPR